MNGELEHCPKPNLLLPVYAALCVVTYHGMIIAADTLSSLRWLMYARFAPLAVFGVVLVQEWPARRSGESSEVDSTPGRVQLLTAFLLGVLPFELFAFPTIGGDIALAMLLALPVFCGYAFFRFLDSILDYLSQDPIPRSVRLSTFVISVSSLLFYGFLFFSFLHAWPVHY